MILLASCGGHSPGATAQPRPGGSGAAVAAGSASPAPPDQPAARDCDKLIAHAVELGAAERPNDQKPTADERASMQTQLRTSWEPKCRAMSSKGYDCALAAQTLAALDACGG